MESERVREMALALTEILSPILKRCQDFRRAMADGLRKQWTFKTEIERIVEILLGEIHDEHPKTFDAFLEKRGVTRSAFSQMSTEEKVSLLDRSAEDRPTEMDNLIAALDLLFEARYGWEPGTVGKMTLWEAFIALEHAVDYDAPYKPSIWEASK